MPRAVGKRKSASPLVPPQAKRQRTGRSSSRASTAQLVQEEEDNNNNASSVPVSETQSRAETEEIIEEQSHHEQHSSAGEEDDEEEEEEDEEEDDDDEMETPASSPEVELALAAAGKTVAPPSNRRRAISIPTDEDEDDDEEQEDDSQVAGQQLSAKTVPGQQPRPSDTTAARPTTGGKGRKGEQAIEQAVAAREQVERRRVELKGDQPANATTSTAAQGLAQLKKEQQEQQDDAKVDGTDQDDSIDTSLSGASAVKKERPAIAEEKANIIRFAVVTNDGNPESLIILAGLMNIFQRQLPKMPREYIARLVFDRNHYSMAIVKRGLQVVGGITYRPFEAREFAEIVFCAITGTEQVKGYGSHLMNHLKDHVKTASKCMHFLTYADNYAIGYFKKQGFSKEIGLDRSVWAGYIKDYEGGTIMHCAMLPKIEYLQVGTILSRQKDVILREIRQVSRSHVVHQGIAKFASLPEGKSLDPADVPGLKESGWTPEMDELTRRPVRGPQFAIMQRLLAMLVDHPSAWAFANPVNAQEVTDYYDVIKDPMDLATMDRKLESNQYKQLDDFVKDARLIFSNCRSYNDASSNYVKNANKLEAFLNEQLKAFNEA